MVVSSRLYMPSGSGTKKMSGTRTIEESPLVWEEARRPAWVKVINAAGKGLRRCGVRWPKVNAESMMAEAQRRTRLADFGDGHFREGLCALVDSFNAQGTAHSFGQLVFREHCTSLLVDRLKIQDELRRHPEILSVPVDRPLFITGLPRSGTTLLQGLMSEDPAARTLLSWEAMAPAPAPEPETYKSDPRIRRQRLRLGLMYQIAPGIKRAHEFEAESPEEDNDLHARSFSAGFFGFVYDVPGFVRWLQDRDYTPTYAYERQQLQLLSWKYRADYWVLKAPSHMFTLEALLSVFPDANIVLTHRDPRRVVASLCSLQAGIRAALMGRLDLRQLGAECLEALSIAAERAIEFHSRCNAARIFDVPYQRLIAEPGETVREICRYFGYNFSAEYEARTRRYLTANPQHKHGTHRYRLEDFGLDEPRVERAFARYIEWLKDRHMAI
jgi:Sulfotransferase family